MNHEPFETATSIVTRRSYRLAASPADEQSLAALKAIAKSVRCKSAGGIIYRRENRWIIDGPESLDRTADSNGGAITLCHRSQIGLLATLLTEWRETLAPLTRREVIEVRHFGKFARFEVVIAVFSSTFQTVSALARPAYT